MPIVSAVGIAVGNHLTADPSVANMLAEVMAHAAAQGQAQGLTDEQIRLNILAARQAALGDYSK
jgi:hypothetical protein